VTVTPNTPPVHLLTGDIGPGAFSVIVVGALLFICLVAIIGVSRHKLAKAPPLRLGRGLLAVRSDRDAALRDIRAARRTALRRMRESTRDDWIEGSAHEIDEAP
jgi:hypothetical protein